MSVRTVRLCARASPEHWECGEHAIPGPVVAIASRSPRHQTQTLTDGNDELAGRRKADSSTYSFKSS